MATRYLTTYLFYYVTLYFSIRKFIWWNMLWARQSNSWGITLFTSTFFLQGIFKNRSCPHCRIKSLLCPVRALCSDNVHILNHIHIMHTKQPDTRLWRLTKKKLLQGIYDRTQICEDETDTNVHGQNTARVSTLHSFYFASILSEKPFLFTRDVVPCAPVVNKSTFHLKILGMLWFPVNWCFPYVLVLIWWKTSVFKKSMFSLIHLLECTVTWWKKIAEHVVQPDGGSG